MNVDLNQCVYNTFEENYAAFKYNLFDSRKEYLKTVKATYLSTVKDVDKELEKTLIDEEETGLTIELAELDQLCTALNAMQTGGKSKPKPVKITILGRSRSIHIIKNKKYVNIQKKLVLLSEVKKMEKLSKALRG
jgi:hypothetical protein